MTKKTDTNKQHYSKPTLSPRSLLETAPKVVTLKQMGFLNNWQHHPLWKVK